MHLYSNGPFVPPAYVNYPGHVFGYPPTSYQPVPIKGSEEVHKGFEKMHRTKTNGTKKTFETGALDTFANNSSMFSICRSFYYEEIVKVTSGIHTPKVFIDVIWKWLNQGGMDNKPASLFCWFFELYRVIKDHSPKPLIEKVLEQADKVKVKTIFMKWR